MHLEQQEFSEIIPTDCVQTLFPLQGSAQMPAFQIGMGKTVGALGRVAEYPHYHRFAAVLKGADNLGLVNALVLMEIVELTARFCRYTHLPTEKVIAIVRDLTYLPCSVGSDTVLTTVPLISTVILRATFRMRTLKLQSLYLSVRLALVASIFIPGFLRTRLLYCSPLATKLGFLFRLQYETV